MTAMYGYAKHAYDDGDRLMFIAVTDGDRVGIVLPADMYGEHMREATADLLQAFAGRLMGLPVGSAQEDILGVLTYNMMVEMALSDDDQFATFEDAAEAAVDHMRGNEWDEYDREVYEVLTPARRTDDDHVEQGGHAPGRRDHEDLTIDEMWAVVSDEDEVIQLVGIHQRMLSLIRADGRWREMTVEEMDASDDMRIVTMGDAFIPVYDAAQAASHTLMHDDLGPFEIAIY